MTKRAILLLFFTTSIFLSLSCNKGSEEIIIDDGGTKEENKEETTDSTVVTIWTYTVEVGISSGTVTALGGFDMAEDKIQEMFSTIHYKFNNPGVFKKALEFKIDTIFVFDGPSSDYCFGPHPDYDYRVIINGTCDANDSGGGWYGGDYNCIHHRWDMNNSGGPFGANAVDGIIHEFGHARGAIDIYALTVDADKNPINSTRFEPARGIMTYPYGETEWDAHTINVINTSADNKHGTGVTEFFPSTIGIKVKNANGDAQSGCTVKVYPVTWFTYTVETTEVASGNTATDGKFTFENNPFDIGAGKGAWDMRYCNFLIEVSNGTQTAYGWMPLYSVQNAFFEGEDDYFLDITL